MTKMIWSDSQCEMVVKGFTVGKKHFTWDDLDEVYYWDEADDTFYMEIPEKAVLD